MVINLNNSHINSFTKGMNSDQAFDQIENTQYILGQNIRITKNLMLGSGDEDYSSTHEGIVAPVPKGEEPIWNNRSLAGEKILATETVDNLGVIITYKAPETKVYRFKLNEKTNEVEEFTLLWKGSNVVEEPAERVSAVLYKELENVIKLYIATGTLPIITIRVDGAEDEMLYDSNHDKYADRDSLMNNRIIPKDPIVIKGVTSGNLLTSQVLYTYRFYNKYKNSTQLAPLTNKIQVINPNRNKDIGNAENTQTSLGFKLGIDTVDYKKDYGRMLIFRLQFIKPGEDAEISMIYDGDVVDTFIDVGADALQSLTIEEFGAMGGLILVPQVILQNLEYMFAANITDDTIIKGLKVNIPNNPIDPVYTKVEIFRGTSKLPSDKGEKYLASYTGEELYIKDTHGNQWKVSDYFTLRGIIEGLAYNTYNNIFTSSLLRSLRRGETYKYGIVYYDKYGRRSDVINIGNIKIPEISDDNYTFENNGQIGDSYKCYSKPYGVKIKLPLPTNDTDHNIIGCLIVRRSSKSIYQNTLLLVAVALPIMQELYTTSIPNLNLTQSPVSDLTDVTHQASPFYPTGFLTDNNFKIGPGYYCSSSDASSDEMDYAQRLLEDGETGYADYHINSNETEITVNNNNTFVAHTKEGQKLYQIFSSEIDFARDDVLLNVTKRESKLLPLYNVSCGDSINNISFDIRQQLNIENRIRFVFNYSDLPSSHYSNVCDVLFVALTSDGSIVIDRRAITLRKSEKIDQSLLLKYDIIKLARQLNPIDINNIKDVIIPNWEDNFTNITRGGNDSDNITTAITKYKSFETSIDQYVYNNWISFAKYGLRPTSEESLPNVGRDAVEELISEGNVKYRTSYEDGWDHKGMLAAGYIGPGPSCFLMSLKDVIPVNNNPTFSTTVCNIKHDAVLGDTEPKEFVLYFGFGNYFKLEYNNGVYNVVNNIPGLQPDEVIVFDGDIYITPHEITTMYKTYNFEAGDSLQSIQIVNYIPLESKVNTYFDYGMNYRNTNSANLLYEPGQIEGVVNQERPVHQYNLIYSDNDASNDVFTLISTDENETNTFKQRTYYSDLKTNGEFIDNFLVFKPASFIDVDSKYGLITNLLTDKNALYYWLEHGFGKFSVNERSLVNDQNGNTIMLGQAGILSRYDYISTKYGMRMYDFCARTAELNVYWVDINNKAIVVGNTSQAANYGEQIGVQNIINKNITPDVPRVDYDLLNSELLCKCFGENLIVFNVKYNLATSIYNRKYDDMVYIKNHMYGIRVEDDVLKFEKYNYLSYSALENGYLSPIKLSFIINPTASVVKVFDNQQIVPIKRSSYTDSAKFMTGLKLAFETDIVNKQIDKAEPYTDREGNLIYAIPRHTNELEYGSRIRGKWLKVDIEKENPDEYFTISHILTKFRQSYS